MKNIFSISCSNNPEQTSSTINGKNIFALLISILLLSSLSNPTFAQRNNQNPCVSDFMLQQELNEHPEMRQSMNWFNAHANQLEKQTRSGDTTYIIPVVFHVFHINGAENISDAQILSQIDVLNADYARKNPDTVNLNPVFNGLGANMHVKFRMATIDPQGNCTNGIVRVYTPLTVNADNNIKHLSVWPTDKYLNVWVVKAIKSISTLGTTLGYAQFPFPFSGGFYSDGVLIRSDYIGTIGTAAAANDKGRVATHEIGHWFGLYHPFQDSCFAGDLVLDTPPVAAPSFGCNPLNSCHNDNPDMPDMIENYMDYADGSCQNIFTLGQRTRAHNAMNQYRWSVFSQNNLVATGTQDGVPASQCLPIAAFDSDIKTVCEGGSLLFHDYSYNGTISSRTWSFPGGTPSSSTQQNPTVTYANAGTYDVTLTVTGAYGNNTKTKSSYVTVSPAVVSVNGIYQGFENTDFPYEWTLTTTGANNWKRYSSYGVHTGMGCAMFENNRSDIDNKMAMISKNINVSTASVKKLSFYYSFTPYTLQGGSITNDKFAVYGSTNCGKTWIQMWSRSGSLLSTLGGVPATTGYYFYYPADDSKWKLVEIDLNSYAGVTNMMFKMEFTCDGGNNIFVDDINIGYATGINKISNALNISMDIFPNPSTENATVKYFLNKNAQVNISLYDLMGRKIETIVSEISVPGEHEIIIDKKELDALARSVYLVELNAAGVTATKKLILE